MHYTDPRHREFLAKIGESVVRWNSIEAAARTLVQAMAKGGLRIDALIVGLGNTSLNDALQTLANEFVEEPLQGHLLHFSKYFDRLREHRNWLIHSVLLLGLQDEKAVGMSSTKSAKGRLVFHQATTTEEEFVTFLEEMGRLHSYVSQIIPHLLGFAHKIPGAVQPLASLEKPLLPDRLKKPRLLLQDIRRPPEASQA